MSIHSFVTLPGLSYHTRTRVTPYQTANFFVRPLVRRIAKYLIGDSYRKISTPRKPATATNKGVTRVSDREPLPKNTPKWIPQRSFGVISGFIIS